MFCLHFPFKPVDNKAAYFVCHLGVYNPKTKMTPHFVCPLNVRIPKGPVLPLFVVMNSFQSFLSNNFYTIYDYLFLYDIVVHNVGCL